MYGVLTAHPARVTPDQAIGDARGFLRARPALRLLLDAAEPFDREIPLDVPVTDRLGRARPGAAAVAGRRRPARCCPFAEHVMMRGVGHVPMTDNPDHVARCCCGAARRRPRSRRSRRPARASGRRTLLRAATA